MKKRALITYLYIGLVIALLASCNSQKSRDGIKVLKNLNKTEIAKVLSAKEEMEAVSFFSDLYQEENKSRIRRLQNNNDEIFEITDDLYIMKEFPEISNNTSFVENRIHGIELETSHALDYINIFKEKVNVSDVWVKGHGIYENELMETNHESISLYRKNNLSSNDFEYLSMNSFEDGRKEVSRVLIDNEKLSSNHCIEGEVYKSFDIFSDYNDYNSYDNTLGYWQFFSSGRILDDTITFSSSSFCENLFYEVIYTKDLASDDMKLHSITIVSPNGEYDVLKYSKYGFDLYLSGFTGVDRIEKKIENGQLFNGSVTLLEKMDVYFENGKSMKVDDTFVDGALTYYNGYGVHPEVSEHTTASLELSMNPYKSFTLVEQFECLKGFLEEVGMTCKIDIDLIMSEVEKINYKAEHLKDSYKWNGYGLDTHTSLEQALQVEIDSLNKYKELHENVKDNKSAIYDENDDSYVYSNLSEVEASVQDLTIDSNEISVNNLRFKVKDTNTLEDDTNYILNLALAKDDSNIISKVLVSTKSENFIFNSSNSEVVINGKYQLPEDLDADEYKLIAYLSTVDGVRATKKVEISAPINEIVTTQTKIINIHTSDGQTKFNYTLNKGQSLLPSKNNYTYDELCEEMAVYAFKHDYEPSLVIEIKEQNTYKEISSTDLITNGTYRMYFTNYQSEDGGYLYLTF